MKIKDLSRITFIHPETIRMYRNLGLLHPKKLENGYYEYTSQDFVSLVYLRKLREFNFSIEEIQEFESSEYPDLLKTLNHKEVELLQQIEEINEKLKAIHSEKRHIVDVMHMHSQKAEIIQSIDDKYDFYSPGNPFLQKNIPFYYLNTTNPIFIPKEILNGPVEDRQIEIQVGVGTYKYMLDHLDLKPQGEYVTVPNGKQISQTLSLTDFHSINLLSLKPMMSFAKEHGHTFISDTTGYLARIHYEHDQPVYDFRIRACIEKNPIIDPFIQI